MKGKKIPENTKALEAMVVAQEAKTVSSGDESIFPDEKPKANNRINPALDKKGSITRQSHADS